jgi:biopolymer transport protein ExbD
MHGIHASEDEPMADMNLIPLIDIALTLLIILMVTTAFIKQPGVSLKLPETATREGAPETNKDTIVMVTSDGSVFVDGQKRTLDQLQTHLKGVAAKDKQARIMLKGDRDVIYKRMMEVMDTVRQAGLTRVVLPTDPKLVPDPPKQAALAPQPSVIANP